MTLYQDLLEIGAEVTNYESDLYVRATATVRKVLERHPEAMRGSSTFLSDGRLWIDIPFAYDPFWGNKTRHEH